MCERRKRKAFCSFFWDSGAEKRIEVEVEQDSSIFAEDMALSTGYVVQLGGCFADVAIKVFSLSFIGQPREISSSVSPLCQN